MNTSAPPVPFRRALEDARSALRRVAKVDPRAATALVTTTVLAGALAPVVPWAARAIVDAIEATARMQTVETRWAVLGFVALEFACVAALEWLRARGRTAEGHLLTRVTADVDHAILEKSLSLELEVIESPAHRELLDQAREEGGYAVFAQARRVEEVAHGALALLGLGSLLASLSWWSILGLAVAVGPRIWIRFAAHAGDEQDDPRTLRTEAQYLDAVLGAPDLRKEVQLFGLGGPFLARLREIQATLENVEARTLAAKQWRSTVVTQLGAVGFYAVYGWLAYQAVRGDISIGR